MSTDSLKAVLSKYPTLNYDKVTNKVQCSLSGHEMPAKEDVIESYVTGKKYLKLLERDDKNYEKYKPHLGPSKKKYNQHQLFCSLTMTHVNKTPAHVERHVNGTKFKRCLARWEECQRTGTEYRPPRGRRKMQENPDMKLGVKSVEDGAQDDEGEISDADSLSDLYPAAALASVDDSEDATEAPGQNDENDSDFDFDEMDTGDAESDTSPKKPVENKGQKRNKMKGGRNHKQKNKKKQKT